MYRTCNYYATELKLELHVTMYTKCLNYRGSEPNGGFSCKDKLKMHNKVFVYATSFTRMILSKIDSVTHLVIVKRSFSKKFVLYSLLRRRESPSTYPRWLGVVYTIYLMTSLKKRIYKLFS